MSRCPERATLQSLARGGLSASVMKTIELHLETCRRCCRALGDIPVGEDLLTDIRDLEESRKIDESLLSTLTLSEEAISRTLFNPP